MYYYYYWFCRFFVFAMVATLCFGEHYQLFEIDSDNKCDLTESTKPASKIECVLRCQRKNQVAVHKGGKKCFCADKQCLEKQNQHENVVDSKKEATTVAVKVTTKTEAKKTKKEERSGFVLDFINPTVNVPTLPGKLMVITNALSMVAWCFFYPGVSKFKDSERFLFTTQMDSIPLRFEFTVRESINTIRLTIEEKMVTIPWKVETNKWIHFSMTFILMPSTIVLALYINGGLYHKEMLEPRLLRPLDYPYKGIALGNDPYRNDPDRVVNGRVTDFYIFNSRLSEHQIKQIYKHRDIPKENRILCWDEFQGRADEVDVKTIAYPKELPN